MKKKLLLTLVLCVAFVFTLAVFVNAEETDCQHTYGKWSVTLGSEGFLGDITASAKCTTCKETATEVIPKIFITLGYSSSSNGVLQGYGVNREALARYEELSGERVKFGGVVALRDTIGDKNPLDENANPISQYVKSYDFTDTDVSVIDVSIKNIPDSVKASAKLLCALYVNVGGRNTYIDNCAEKTYCGAKTFDEIEAVPEVDTTVLEKVEVIEGTRYHEITIEEMGFVQGKFWNNTTMQTGANAAFDNKFWTTKKFTKDTLPIGSIIFIDSENDWQYRPHKWNGTRPKNTKTETVTVDEAWWGSFTNVGFNISMYDGNGPTEDTGKLLDISGYTVEEIAEIFKIYVPVSMINDDNNQGGDNQGGNQGGSQGGGNENPGGGNEGGSDDEEVIPPSPDYSDVKQNWADDGELKILAIGNSFSDDTMEYVYQIAKDAGVEKITLGNMYIGGCSLATHLSNAKNDKGAYTYRTNTSGTWTSRNSVSIKTAVTSDDWDFISFQQVSGYSGIADSYDDLVDLINIVEPLNPSARLVWNMTWAYKVGSGHSDFPKYNKDQMTMYNAIVSAVNSKILTNNKIEIVIPAGTAIQNVRTSFIGDTTRDGYHLSYGIGRYIASMTFVKAVTGLSIDNSVTTPSDVDSYELKAIIDSVNNAIKTPFAVTQSSYPTTQGGTGGDDSANVGVIPEGYVQLTATQMGLTFASFYNTTGSSSWEDVNNSFARGFMATKKFTREELPVGSIIEISAGWQYRPEGWKFASARPDNVTTLRIIIDDAWWGSYTERAFNISQIAHTTAQNVPITQSVDEVATYIFKIIVPEYAAPKVEEPETPETPDEPDTPVTPDEPDVPVTPDEPEDGKVYVKSSDCEEEIVVINGKEYRALTLEAMGFVKNAYYYSSHKGAEIYETGTSGTPAKFYATKIFTEEDLPLGAVIWVNKGWQYRPEGWKFSVSRPGNVTTTYVTADESWWGSHTQKGFNISKTNGGSLVNVSAEEVYENFKIYIPVENIID